MSELQNMTATEFQAAYEALENPVTIKLDGVERCVVAFRKIQREHEERIAALEVLVEGLIENQKGPQ